MHPAVRAIVIPPCPQSLLRLQSIMAEPEIDATALDQLASSDVAMAAALIRLANSPLHALAQPVQTVGMALTVLGLQPAVDLLAAFITRNALLVQSPLLDHFWESSQRKAIACEHIGRQLYSLDPGLGYSFGLFCHVGMPVLMKAVRGYASTVTEALARKDRTFTQTENANHRTDHAVRVPSWRAHGICRAMWHRPSGCTTTSPAWQTSVLRPPCGVWWPWVCWPIIWCTSTTAWHPPANGQSSATRAVPTCR